MKKFGIYAIYLFVLLLGCLIICIFSAGLVVIGVPKVIMDVLLLVASMVWGYWLAGKALERGDI